MFQLPTKRPGKRKAWDQLYLESVGGIGGDRAELAESVEDEMMKKDEKVDEGGNDGMGATMIQVRWVLPSVPYHPIE